MWARGLDAAPRAQLLRWPRSNAIRGSRALDRSSPCSSRRCRPAVVGCCCSGAPEQTGRMNRSIDFRSDLYALGVTFYQMLTGPLPFTASYVKSASFSEGTSTLSRMKTASHLAVDVGGDFPRS